MLTKLADDIWTSSTLLGLGGVSITRRMTVVRLPGGSLWIHSPNDLNPELLDAVQALGPVGWLVAPNLLHHRALGEWKTACPDALLLGVAGLAEKKPGIAFDGAIRDQPPDDWGAALELAQLEGAPSIGEVAFFHLSSRTLILTDYVFNQGDDSGLPWFSARILGWMKAYGRLGPSRLFGFYVQDRAAVGDCVRGILKRWPVKRLSMSHGQVVEKDAADRLRTAYAGW